MKNKKITIPSIEEIEIIANRYKEFQKKWPKRCHGCGMAGHLYEWDFNTKSPNVKVKCSKCSEKGKCPRCGSKGYNFEGESCNKCGFNSETWEKEFPHDEWDFLMKLWILKSDLERICGGVKLP